MKIAVVTANYGDFDEPENPVQQSIEHDYFRYTERNFPLRDKAITPRLQARLVKCFAWQMLPGYDYYVWHDSSVQLSHKYSLTWLIHENTQVVVLKHPNRDTVGEEAQYLKDRLESKDKYITSRYEHELIDEQMKEVDAELPLYASTVFAYRPSYDVKLMMKEWWYHISRYHIIDQLSLPHVLKDKEHKVLEDNFLTTKFLKHTR